MDKTPFTLSAKQKVRRVGKRGSSRKSQSSLPDDVHITVVTTISTSDAVVPPFIIYPGENLLEEWLEVRDPKPYQVATATTSGYTNSYMHKRWSIDCFDRYTKERAEGRRRLLFLDGLDAHLTIDFLETAWELNIVCVCLPAHMSSTFQPLDVNFFSHLKRRYNRLVSDWALETSYERAPKGLFYRWHQRAWIETATS